MESMWPWCGSQPGKPRPKLTLLAHEGFAFPAALRRAVLAAMNAASTSTAELARLNWRLGLAYAEAVSATRQAAQRQAGPDWLPRADALSSAARRELCGPALRLHLAGGRSGGDCRGARRSGGLELSSRGYAGRRPGRAAGSAARLRALCRCQARARAAEYRRHRQPDGDSRRGRGGRRDRLRHRSRQHGDRRAGAGAFRQALRPQRSLRRRGHGALRRC